MLIELLNVIIGSIVITVILMGFISISLNWQDFKYYNTTYKALKNGTYVLMDKTNMGDVTIYTLQKESEPFSFHTRNEIIFFIRKDVIDSIKLLSDGNHYIHSSTIKFDFYSQHWFKKISKAFLELDLNRVELTSLDDKIKDLLK